MDTPTQTLSGQWAYSSFPANFGFALRGNTDLDHNGYPGTAHDPRVSFVQQHWQLNSLYLLADLIVGAFGVDKAVLYRYVTLSNVIDGTHVEIFLFSYSFLASPPLRARPIVSVRASLAVQPTLFNQEEKTCELFTGTGPVAVSWYGWKYLPLKHTFPSGDYIYIP